MPNPAVGEARAATKASKDDVLIYVGAGCFWHTQHEMTVAEQSLLGRDGNTFTAVAGYAGGNKLGKNGKLCYHNMAFDSDYASFGHTEVVAVQVPSASVEGFVKAYVDLFDTKGVRHDPQDQGGEYRSAIGLPGGVTNGVMQVLTEAAAKKGMTVEAGKGDEGDSLRDRSIFVYDTAQFPFHSGELYHQYHNDMTENYGKKYNALRDSKAAEGALSLSKCPGDAKLTGVFASGDFASAGIFEGFFKDKSVND